PQTLIVSSNVNCAPIRDIFKQEAERTDAILEEARRPDGKTTKRKRRKTPLLGSQGVFLLQMGEYGYEALAETPWVSSELVAGGHLAASEVATGSELRVSGRHATTCPTVGTFPLGAIDPIAPAAGRT
ncbi:hypothetical protein AAFF_G00366860, partial [Aldrovandia affinis]